MEENKHNVDDAINKLLTDQTLSREQLETVQRIAEHISHLNELKRRKQVAATNLIEQSAADQLQDLLRNPSPSNGNDNNRPSA